MSACAFHSFSAALCGRWGEINKICESVQKKQRRLLPAELLKTFVKGISSVTQSDLVLESESHF